MVGEFVETHVKEIIIRGEDGTEKIVDGCAVLAMFNRETGLLSMLHQNVEDSDDIFIFKLAFDDLLSGFAEGGENDGGIRH